MHGHERDVEDTCDGKGKAPAAGRVCDRSNEIWAFGEKAFSAISAVLRLRDSLRPYIMEQYRQVSHDGTPMVRPLFWEFADDEGAADVVDQMMTGPEILVAPQFRRLNETGASRPRLPAEAAKRRNVARHVDERDACWRADGDGGHAT